MLEPVTSDVTGESSTPVVAEPTATPRALGELSHAERMEWRKTGTIPTPKDPAPLAASPAATPVEGQAVSTETTIEPASEPGDYKTKTAKRINELLEGQTREKERADRLERELGLLRQPRVSQPIVAQPIAGDPEPDPTKYEDLTKYFKDQAQWAARDMLRQRDVETAQHSHDQQVAADTARIRTEWDRKWKAGVAKHKDFADIAGAPTEIPQGSLVDAWILEADEGAEVLYHLQKNPADVRRILALPPLKQAAELVKIGEKTTAVPPVKIVTSAPDPSPTLGVRGADTGTEAERAIRKKDPKAYIAAKNREEMALKRK